MVGRVGGLTDRAVAGLQVKQDLATLDYLRSQVAEFEVEHPNTGLRAVGT